jgi:hypothetical protein
MKKVENYLFLDSICSISVFDLRLCMYYTWKDEKKNIFGLISRESGFYEWQSEYPTPVEDIIRDNRVIIDDVVYKKPKMVIYLKDGSTYTQHFDDVNEIYVFIRKNGLDKKDHIIL